MRIAFFGGSFDPPHRGHLAIARAAAVRLSLDRVWLAPAGRQPLKPTGTATGFADRLAMVKLAVTDDPRLAASAIDAPRADGLPNYSIDVLSEMRRGLAPGDALFFLMGADACLSLRKWHRAAELPFAAEFIVAGRPGFSIEDLSAVLPEGVSATPAASLEGVSESVIVWELHGSAGQRSRLFLLPELHEEVSATEIRAALAGEESAEGVLSPAVSRYIELRGLYR
jgi:nicotinate-nucleotide adenylyltransferase